MDKYFIKSLLIISLLVVLAGCRNTETFDKNKWQADEIGLVNGKVRLRMLKWLEKNYDFGGKTSGQIIEMFAAHGAERAVELIAKDQKIEFTIQQDSEFFTLLPEFPPRVKSWMTIYFNDNDIVGRVTFDTAKESRIRYSATPPYLYDNLF